MRVVLAAAAMTRGVIGPEDDITGTGCRLAGSFSSAPGGATAVTAEVKVTSSGDESGFSSTVRRTNRRIVQKQAALIGAEEAENEDLLRSSIIGMNVKSLTTTRRGSLESVDIIVEDEEGGHDLVSPQSKHVDQIEDEAPQHWDQTPETATNIQPLRRANSRQGRGTDTPSQGLSNMDSQRFNVANDNPVGLHGSLMMGSDPESKQAYRALMNLMGSNVSDSDDHNRSSLTLGHNISSHVKCGSSLILSDSDDHNRSSLTLGPKRGGSITLSRTSSKKLLRRGSDDGSCNESSRSSGYWSAMGTKDEELSSSNGSYQSVGSVSSGSTATSVVSEYSPLTAKKRKSRQTRQLYVRLCARAVVTLVVLAGLSLGFVYKSTLIEILIVGDSEEEVVPHSLNFLTSRLFVSDNEGDEDHRVMITPPNQDQDTFPTPASSMTKMRAHHSEVADPRKRKVITTFSREERLRSREERLGALDQRLLERREAQVLEREARVSEREQRVLEREERVAERERRLQQRGAGRRIMLVNQGEFGNPQEHQARQLRVGPLQDGEDRDALQHLFAREEHVVERELEVLGREQHVTEREEWVWGHEQQLIRQGALPPATAIYQ